ncbi:MAG: hypothetical protein ACI93N_001639 [Flavobacteriaceae bacterium]|jgi:hypothetical protein
MKSSELYNHSSLKITRGYFEMSKYWSSTEHSGGTGYAFNFATGESNIGYNGILNCRVRLVRSKP